jgi:hypothetical protein
MDTTTAPVLPGVATSLVAGDAAETAPTSDRWRCFDGATVAAEAVTTGVLTVANSAGETPSRSSRTVSKGVAVPPLAGIVWRRLAPTCDAPDESDVPPVVTKPASPGVPDADRCRALWGVANAAATDSIVPAVAPRLRPPPAAVPDNVPASAVDGTPPAHCGCGAGVATVAAAGGGVGAAYVVTDCVNSMPSMDMCRGRAFDDTGFGTPPVGERVPAAVPPDCRLPALGLARGESSSNGTAA